MEIIQNALSQDCESILSSQSTKSDIDQFSRLPVSTDRTELGRAAPPGPEDENQTSPEQEKGSQLGCGPQSPWTAETPLPGVASGIHEEAAVAHAERDIPADTDSSPPQAEGPEDWQRVEYPTTSENDGIKPFKDFMTPTPSPERNVVHTDGYDIPSTQLLIEAATNNPWASNPKNRISRKPKKRVSWGILPSEEKNDSQTGVSTLSKQVSGSPPPPQTVDGLRDEDAFEDGTTAINKFGSHFSAVTAGFQRLFPRDNNSDILSSPAVGAMAEAFIAADRKTHGPRTTRSVRQKRYRHLRPKSDARTNVSSPEGSPDGKVAAATTMDYDLSDDLDDFLRDAGDFLGDWSVEAEIKKANESRGRREGEIESGSRKGLFKMSR